MKYLYYPGCTLKTKAIELDNYAKAAMVALGIDFVEFDDWQCCGATYPLARDEIAPRLSAIRALDKAKQEGRALLSLCSACHNVLKRVNYDMAHDRDVCEKANNYLQLDEPYTGETRVVHFLEMLRDDVGFEALKSRVVNPLAGRKIAAYYGCLLLRPSKIMAFDNPDNPSVMEEFIRAIGAEPVVFSKRNECCGSHVAINDSRVNVDCCNKIISSAKNADSLVTVCPLCRYNLQTFTDSNTQILYLTELLAIALGVKE